MNKGWVKLHRKLLENVDLMADHTALYMFIILLLKANPKGQILTSTRQLAEDYKMVHTTVYRATQRLEKYGITQQSTQHRKTLITICNWGKYQNNTQRSVQHSRNSDATLTQRPPLDVRIENKNKESELAIETPLAPNKSFRKQYESLRATNGRDQVDARL